MTVSVYVLPVPAGAPIINKHVFRCCCGVLCGYACNNLVVHVSLFDCKVRAAVLISKYAHLCRVEHMFESQVFGVEMNNGWQSHHVVCASVMLKAEVDFSESGIVRFEIGHRHP